MRASASLVAGFLVSAALAGSAAAATLEWQGSLSIPFPARPGFTITGTGVATVNGSGGRGHLNTLRLAGGLTGSTSVPLTDPATPTVFTAIPRAQLGTGTLAPISDGGPLTSNTLPLRATWKVCILFPGCGIYQLHPLTKGGTAGFGIGGTFTVGGYSSYFSPKYSVVGAPWTIGVASVTGVHTENGGTTTVTAQGFAHGPASGTSSTARLGGALQLVTPIRIVSFLGIFNRREFRPLFAIAQIRFIPEPGLLLLLGSGVAGLLLLGRGRSRG